MPTVPPQADPAAAPAPEPRAGEAAAVAGSGAAAQPGGGGPGRAPFASGTPQVRAADFVAESRTVSSLPPVGPVEVAIAGRSNVGKSTLLNRLAGRRGLARTSKTPGRTRGIVFYDLQVADGDAARALRLADLPGYGYAQVSKAERNSWQELIEGYASRRPTLALFVVLVDARRGIEDEERQLVEWLASIGVRDLMVFTKIDKLSASERGLLRQRARAALGGESGGGAGRGRRTLAVSGETGEGLDALWAEIGRALPREG